MVFELIFKHSWIFLLVVNLVNYLIIKTKSKNIISQKPELEKGYHSILNSFLIFGNIPWLIIGFGDLTSQTTTVFDFFQPRKLNPVVIIFHLYILGIMSAFVFWAFFRNGAEFLEKHPGIIRFRGMGDSVNPSKNQIKRILLLCALGTIGGLLTLWFSDFPNPLK